ncbi:MAG: methyltransferase [Saprospirales bacterium]|nr:methyltransferase [Saprospirales bacterium]MBK8491613.1 methyltransferase [Saprospirales bacterium]
MNQSIRFFQEGIKNLKTVGTITRSSPFLCRKMTSMVDFGEARVIAELGAGDGAITRHILSQMHPDGKLLAFEVLPQLCELLHQIDDPRLIVVEDSAERISAYLEKEGLQQIDYVLSAIPFVVLPQELSLNILAACREVLRPGGLFVQVHYSLLAKKLYEEIFGNVRVHFMPWNIPPAFVLVSKRT